MVLFLHPHEVTAPPGVVVPSTTPPATDAFDRAVNVKTWAEAIQPEATVGPGGVSIKNTTKASVAGGVVDGTTTPGGAVTSCG
jgi:hypothetical protein